MLLVELKSGNLTHLRLHALCEGQTENKVVIKTRTTSGKEFAHPPELKLRSWTNDQEPLTDCGRVPEFSFLKSPFSFTVT